MSERSEEQQSEKPEDVELRDLEVPDEESPAVKGGVSDAGHKGEIDIES